MLCRKPFVAHVKRTINGRQNVYEVPTPCGQCFHCRLNQARIWQTRLMLESMTAADSAFFTLTYDPIHEPIDRQVCPKVLKKFF